MYPHLPLFLIPQTVVFFVSFHIIVLFVLYSYLFILIISTFCDKFTKEKALDKTNLFFGLIHEPIMQLNYGRWLICLSINLFAVLYVHIFGSEINLNLKKSKSKKLNTSYLHEGQLTTDTFNRK